MIFSELHSETVNLSGEENMMELCKREKNIRKTYSPGLSGEIPVVSYNFQKAYHDVHEEICNLNLSSSSVYVPACVWIPALTDGACGYCTLHECSLSRQTECDRQISC